MSYADQASFNVISIVGGLSNPILSIINADAAHVFFQQISYLAQLG